MKTGPSLFMVLVVLVSSTTFGAYGGGTGSSGDPYRIYTPEQMNDIGATPADWDRHFKLMANIDMSIYTGTGYNIIGNSTDKFTGTFDGNHHKIRNLTYTTTTAVDSVGLFGFVDYGGQIKNLGVESVQITGGSYVGGLVGSNYSGLLTNCYVTGSVCGTGLYSYVGGLVGYNNSGTIEFSEVKGNITGAGNYVGGLVGYNNSGTIEFSYVKGNVTGEGNYVGGLVGYNNLGATIIFGCALGEVSGRETVGGLVGWNNRGVITSCYATATVDGEAGIGGLVGENDFGTITSSYAAGAVRGDSIYVGGLAGYNYGAFMSCFWDIETSGQSVGVGEGEDTGVIGKVTVEMKMLSTFSSPPANWDFVNVWTVCETTNYPRLRWRKMPDGDWSCPDGVAGEDMAYFSERWLMTGRCNLGDWNKDGKVNLLDFASLAPEELSGFVGSWLNEGCVNLTRRDGDINGDNIVNLADFCILAANWLEGT